MINLATRSPGGVKYEVDRNLNRDGVSCYCKVNRDLVKFYRLKIKLLRKRKHYVLFYYMEKH